METERAQRLRAATEPAWDDLREQRLLARIVQARAEEAARPKRRSFAKVYVALAVAAAVLFFVFGLPRLRARSTVVATTTPVTAPVTAPSAGGQLTLVDGSVASLGADAQVRVDAQSLQRVELTQLAGRVHYDVTHDTTRPFRVHVGNVVVSVHGTRFVVTAAGDTVEVRVEQGVVGVDDGAREREVGAGETLIVPGRLGVSTGASATSADGNDSATSGGKTAPTGLAGKPPTANLEAPPTATTLLARADDARAKGRIADAATALRQLLAQFPGDPRTPSAAFTLGKLERRLGRPADAARAFARCRAAAPGGALAMDALAEEALSWSAAGQTQAARDAAQRYLAKSPGGAYAPRMTPLVSGAN